MTGRGSKRKPRNPNGKCAAQYAFDAPPPDNPTGVIDPGYSLRGLKIFSRLGE